MESPYHTFWNWCFDGYKKTPIPKPTDNIPDILKYNSPINETFLLRSFIKHEKLNHFLNKNINNINSRYIDKKELFFFIKQCVQKYKIKKNNIYYLPRHGYKENLFNKLKQKYPVFKNSDIELMIELINKNENRDSILGALGIDKPKKTKVKNKKTTTKKISLKKFITVNFNIVKVEI